MRKGEGGKANCIPAANMIFMFCCVVSVLKMQTVDYCFHHANEYLTTIVPLFSNPKDNSLQSVLSLHFTLPLLLTPWARSRLKAD